MLLEVDARGLPNCQINSIALQRGQEGYPLDDVIVHGQDRNGRLATLQIQVKRSITFAPSDEVFQDVVKQVKKAMDDPAFWEGRHQLAVAIARTNSENRSSLSGCPELGTEYRRRDDISREAESTGGSK
jgi:hypothetical protein